MNLESPPDPCAQVRASLERMAAEGKLSWNPILRAHVDECSDCWRSLVAARWRIADGSRDIAELREFLGEAFQSGIDPSWLLVDDWHASARSNRQQIEAFYRHTPWYIYNLTLWQASGQRAAYVDAALPVLGRHRVQSILDFGAGVGTDSLRFCELGLAVVASEFDNQTSRFLRWRARKRGCGLSFISADELESTPFGVDMIWALDVVEHLPDPAATLTSLLERASVFVYDSEHMGTSKGRHPFHFQHDPNVLAAIWIDLGYVRDERCSIESGLEVFARKICDSSSENLPSRKGQL